MTQVLRGGTMSDKVAAMALAVQHNPMQSLGTLDALLALARKKSRRESQLASDSLFDLFQGGLLPPDRELVRFHEVPGVESPAATPSHLRFWLFEDLLKQRYREFVLLQESTLQDGLVHFKMATLKRAGSLAGAAPEQRRLLVSMVANRLGDVEKKVASTAGYVLSQLVEAHKDLSVLVAGTVQQMVLRPKTTPRGKYYAVVFLNQLVLTKGSSELPNTLMRIYFALFEACLEGTGAKSKLLAALLTGVNRAFPYSALDADFMAARVNALFRIVHTTTFNTSVQALRLLSQVCAEDPALSARFYRTLYSSMSSPDLHTTSKHSLYLSLLLRSFKHDKNGDRVCAMVKRLLQIAAGCSAAFTAAALFIVAEVVRLRADVRRLVLRPESGVGGASAAPSGADLREERLARGGKARAEANDAAAAPAPVSNATQYDATKRDPQFAGAEKSCLWELAVLAAHYHPSVRKFAEHVMVNPKGTLEYQGDPLMDFTLMAFLDRFSFRNPKKKTLAHEEAVKRGPSAVGATPEDPLDAVGEDGLMDDAAVKRAYDILAGVEETVDPTRVGKLRGSALMQPLAPRRGRVAVEEPANSLAFRQLQPHQVREDDMFVYKYMQAKPLVEKSKAPNLLDDGEVDLDEEERAEDAVADQLAEKLLRASGGDLGEDHDVDADEFAYSDDDEDALVPGDDDDGEDEEADSDDDVEGAASDDEDAGLPSDLGSDGEDEDGLGDEDEDEDDDDVPWQALGGDDSDEDEDDDAAPAPVKTLGKRPSGRQMTRDAKGKAGAGKRARSTASVFADAEDSD